MALTMSMSTQVAYLVTQNAIENKQVNDTIAKASHVEEQGEIAAQNAEKANANGLREAMAYVSMAQSAVKVVQSAQAIPQAVDTAKQQSATQTELKGDLSAR